MNKKVSKDDYNALLELNILDIVGVSKLDTESQEKYLEKYFELTLNTFLRIISASLNPEQIKILNDFSSKNSPEDFNKFLEENYPQYKEDMLTASLIVKEEVISHHIGKLLFKVSNYEQSDKEKILRRLQILAKSVKDRFWVRFSQNLDLLYNIENILS